jgi:hypothetical protein
MHAFRWYSAASLVFLLLDFYSLTANHFWRILFVMFGEDSNLPIHQKVEALNFLETIVKTNKKNHREKSKVPENQVFWLVFCAKKRIVHTPSDHLSSNIFLHCLTL